MLLNSAGLEIRYLNGDAYQLVFRLIGMVGSIGCEVDDEFVQQDVVRILNKAKSGRLRSHRDYKEIKTIETPKLYELRFSFASTCGNLRCRLFFNVDHSAGLMTLIDWHIKDPTSTPDEQREKQNEAALQASILYERKVVEDGTSKK